MSLKELRFDEALAWAEELHAGYREVGMAQAIEQNAADMRDRAYMDGVDLHNRWEWRATTYGVLLMLGQIITEAKRSFELLEQTFDLPAGQTQAASQFVERIAGNAQDALLVYLVEGKPSRSEP